MRSQVVLYVIFLLPLTTVVLLILGSSRYDRRSGTVRGQGFLERNGAIVATYLVLATFIWIFVTIIFPQIAMVDLSFRPNLPPRQAGGPDDHYTLDNYRYFLFGPPGSTDLFNFLHLNAYVATIVASVCITIFNFLLCYPIAYFMAQSAYPRTLRRLIAFLILPYWVNEVLRVFAIRLLLSNSGIVNNVLIGTGILTEPVDFIGNNVGLYWGLSYSCILVMVFTLYNALESLEKSQIEAARDLGAPWWHVHAFVAMPHAKPGIASGCSLTFMFCVGSLAAPLVLGGPRTLWFTPVIYNRFYQALNWPQGAAYAFILLVSCVIFVLVTLRLFRLRLGQIAR